MATIGVLGGGPAGSIFAARMVQLGHRVVIIERRAAPKIRFGETVGVAFPSLLAAAGLADCAYANLSRAPELSASWGASSGAERDFPLVSFAVDRVALDASLLGKAARFGARVVTGAVIVAFESSPRGHRLGLRTAQGEETFACDFLVRAMGRSGSQARSRRVGAPTIALCGVGIGPPTTPAAHLEAFHDGWAWSLASASGLRQAAIYISPGVLRQCPGSLRERLRDWLVRSEPASGFGEINVSFASATDCTAQVGRDIVAATTMSIGNSAVAIDPISSSGLLNATQTALTGAIVANTILRRPGSADLAFSHYRDAIGRISVNHALWAASNYRAVAERFSTPFWLARQGDNMAAPAPPAAVIEPSAPDAPVLLAPDVEFLMHAAVEGDYVTTAEAVQSPRLGAPIAYVGGQRIAPLLRRLRGATTKRALARLWADAVAPEAAMEMANWLQRAGVLTSPTA